MTTATTIVPVRRLSELTSDEVAALTRRSAVPDAEIRRRAEAICEDVRQRGDAAVSEASRRYGGGRPDPTVPADERSAALQSISEDSLGALTAMIDAVRTVHEPQRPAERVLADDEGIQIVRRWAPLRRVGVYVPGGKAAYPSSLIMGVVPALVAGVGEVVVVTPAGPDGTLSPELLAAAELLGVDELYAMGGAQAVGALAHGTETIEPVDTIVGPGNAYVTAAKLAVLGTCGIDMPAGPSEVLVVADETADPRLVAIDLLCQAEHGPDSPAVLVTTQAALAASVNEAIHTLLPSLSRASILRQGLSTNAIALVVDHLDEAVEFANAYASEHVSVLTAQPQEVADRITRAGSVYVGRWAPESAGDYATGANHVLPTGGLARSYGPLSVETFGTWRQVQTIDEQGLRAIRPTIEQMSRIEGLDAHGLAAAMRFTTEEPT